MKLLIRGDDHFALNSSIILGSTGSTKGRLNNLIDSYKWFYNLAKGYDMTVDMGDLTDSPTLRSEVITAISEAFSYRNDSIPEMYILGNHERLSSDGNINAVNFLSSMSNYTVYTNPSVNIINRVMFCVYPYVSLNEDELDKFKSWIDTDVKSVDKKSYDRKLLFTHNDLFGADLGGWVSKSGLDPNLLSKNFDLTFNGHIHNGSWVKKNVLNLGSLSGQNFSSKFVNWEPSIASYDTDTNKVELIPNPHALKFRTVTANSKSDLIKKIADIKGTDSYGISAKVPLDLIDETRRILNNTEGIVGSRVQEKISKNSLDEESDGTQLSKFSDSKNGYETLRDYIDQTDLPTEIKKDEVLSIVKELEEYTSES